MRSFFFYDLETSGFSPRHDRIMQFAGQRTDTNLKPVGDPVNLLIKMTDDTLPSPGAIMTTGITPQSTLEDGFSEAEFCEYFLEHVATPETIFIGYNSIRFDDEFMRHTLWRNFHDPYEWEWSEKRGRWDMLDVARFVRAIRPEGINWPTKKVQTSDGEWKEIGTVNLVDMAASNDFTNKNAHDALADVNALINLSRLLKDKQPKMLHYLYTHRDKTGVAEIIRPDAPQPFVYVSGRYPSENEKATAAIVIARGRTPTSALVWDLRYKVSNLNGLSEQQILDNLTANCDRRREPDYVSIPVKELNMNRCPAVAPIGTIKGEEDRIHLTIDQIQENLHDLRANPDTVTKVINAWQNRLPFAGSKDVEDQLYDGFAPDSDKDKIRLVAAANGNDLADMHPNFSDKRLPELLFRYKARQFPKSLNTEERKRWEQYRMEKLKRELPPYMQELAKLDQEGKDSFLLTELQLWAESIIPADD